MLPSPNTSLFVAIIKGYFHSTTLRIKVVINIECLPDKELTLDYYYGVGNIV